MKFEVQYASGENWVLYAETHHESFANKIRDMIVNDLGYPARVNERETRPNWKIGETVYPPKKKT